MIKITELLNSNNLFVIERINEYNICAKKWNNRG